ncbi:MAG: hypothetical protein ACWA5L_07755 [bacterium]
MKRFEILLACVFAAFCSSAAAQDDHDSDLVIHQPDGAVSNQQGLQAWQRLYEVVSHPRCANCHTGEENIPMWSGPSYGQPRRHGMNINADPSRAGIEYIPCSTCHITSSTENNIAHAAPHTGLPWMLAPVEFEWFGKDSASICQQIRNPDRNGGRDGAGLVDHILHDAELSGFISWGFTPGEGRQPAPGSMQSHLDDMVLWTAAGMPCPNALD